MSLEPGAAPRKSSGASGGAIALSLLVSAAVHVAALGGIEIIHWRQDARAAPHQHVRFEPARRVPVSVSFASPAPPARTIEQTVHVTPVSTGARPAKPVVIARAARIPTVDPAPAPPAASEAQCHEIAELSQRPQLMSSVDLQALTQSPPADPGRMLIRLLINHQGDVERVLVDDSNLPPVLEQAAIDAFLKAKYSPGQIDETAVCSQIRIEVTYDGPLDGADTAL